MDKAQQIRERLREMSKQVGPACTLLGTVQNITADTCDIVDDDSSQVFYAVRLRTVTNGTKSITLIPKEGTWALAIRIEDDEDWMLISCGELDTWNLSISEAVIEQNETGLLIQNGEDTLKDTLTMIIQAVQQIVVVQGTNPDYTKLTQALQKVNNILR